MRTRVTLLLPESETDDVAPSLLAASTNLLARLFARLDVCAPATPRSAPPLTGAGPLDVALVDLARQVNPLICARRVDEAECDEASVLVHIGETRAEKTRKVRLDANGWHIHVSTNGEAPPWGKRWLHPAAPLAAASLAVSHVLRPTLGDPAPQVSRVNLLDYSSNVNEEGGPPLPPLRLPDVPVFGTGSIGSALAYCLLEPLEWTGKIQFVDNESFDDDNITRYVLMRHSDVGQAKAERAATLVRERQPELEASSAVRDIGRWARDLDERARFELAVLAPDNHDARREAADTLPRAAVVGSIDATRAIVNHCHFARTLCGYCPTLPPERGPRLEAQWQELTGLSRQRVIALGLPEAKSGLRRTLDRRDLRTIEERNGYPRGALRRWEGDLIEKLVEAELPHFYAAVAIRDKTPHPPVRLALGFVSAFAGALALNEVVKETVPSLHSDGYTKFAMDLVTLERRLGLELRDQTLRCICRSHDRHRWFARIWPEDAEALRAWSTAL